MKTAIRPLPTLLAISCKFQPFVRHNSQPFKLPSSFQIKQKANRPSFIALISLDWPDDDFGRLGSGSKTSMHRRFGDLAIPQLRLKSFVCANTTLCWRIESAKFFPKVVKLIRFSLRKS